MGIWLRVRQALAVMDLVMKTWGAALRLSSAEVTALLMVKEHGTLCGAVLASSSGKRRQHVHRALGRLERRGLLRVTRRAPRGKSHDWGLTAVGDETVRRIAERMALWEAMLGEREELGELAERLERMVRAAVNRPTGGLWAQGLSTPEELRRYPAWDDETLKALVRAEVEALRGARVPRDPGPTRKEEAPAGATASAGVVPREKSEAEEWAAVEENWLAMWR